MRASSAIGLERAVAVAVTMEQLSAITRHDTSTRLAALEMPTLVVHGTEDRDHPRRERAHGRRPDPRRAPGDLPEIGHLFFWELPERSAELVREHALVHA